jgi:hypothetical protein
MASNASPECVIVLVGSDAMASKKEDVPTVARRMVDKILKNLETAHNLARGSRKASSCDGKGRAQAAQSRTQNPGAQKETNVRQLNFAGRESNALALAAVDAQPVLPASGNS